VEGDGLEMSGVGSSEVERRWIDERILIYKKGSLMSDTETGQLNQKTKELKGGGTTK
jgi:hypothetical protein